MEKKHKPKINSVSKVRKREEKIKKLKKENQKLKQWKKNQIEHDYQSFRMF